jgi:hypothetical protein
MRHEQKLIAKKRSFVTFKLETIAHFLDAVNSKSLLKFLVTSRPYAHILREFQPLKNHVPEIHIRVTQRYVR